MVKMLDPVHVSPWGVYIITPGATAQILKEYQNKHYQ
jgi:hypothetical protein